MKQALTPEYLQILKDNGVVIISLDEYKQKINQWGFDIDLKILEEFACHNSLEIANGISINYMTSKAVLAEKLNGKLVTYSNIAGYALIPQNDPRRKAFTEYRMTEPYFIHKGKLWMI